MGSGGVDYATEIICFCFDFDLFLLWKLFTIVSLCKQYKKSTSLIFSILKNLKVMHQSTPLIPLSKLIYFIKFSS